VLTTAVIAVVLGFVSGVIGSLVAPWVHWGIEKRRQRFAARKEILNACRQALNSTDFNIFAFREGPAYAAIRDHLTEKAREQFESVSGTKIYVSGSGPGQGNVHRRALADELARIGKLWGLV